MTETPESDIDFKQWLEKLTGLISVNYKIDIYSLMQAVESINTSSGNIDGKRLFIGSGRAVYWIWQINHLGVATTVIKSFYWSEHNGMQGALTAAVHFIYLESRK